MEESDDEKSRVLEDYGSSRSDDVVEGMCRHMRAAEDMRRK